MILSFAGGVGHASAPLVINGLSGDGEAEGLRFYIKDDGLYRVEASQVLARLGATVPLASDDISLFSSKGEEFLLMEDGGDGVFGNNADDHLLFYGQFPRGGSVSTRRNFNDHAPYWLVVNREAAAYLSERLASAAELIDIYGARSQTDENTPLPLRYQRWSEADARQSFPNALFFDTMLQRERQEADYYYKRWLGATEADSDFYYWAPISTAQGRDVFKPHRPVVAERLPDREKLESERYSDMQPEIRVKVMSDSKAKHGEGVPDHLLQVKVGEATVGELTFDGQGVHEWASKFSADLVDERGQINVQLVVPDERLELVDRMHLDWIEVGYPTSIGGWNGGQQWVSTEGMKGGENGGVNLYTRGWPTNQVRLLDPALGRIYEPVLMQSRSNIDWNVGFRAELPKTANVGEGGRAGDPFHEVPGFYLFTSQATNDIVGDEMEVWNFVNPIETVSAAPGRAFHLLVTHRALGDAPQKLSEHRAAQGLETAVVEIDTLFDFYTAGYHSKEALKQFIADVKSEDETAIQYVTLFGDSSYDYKGYQARWKPERRIAGINLLPLHYYDARHTTRPVYPADHLFVASTKEVDLPLAAIGRIPAASHEEATAYYEKVLAYEAGSKDRPEWNRRALLVSSWERSFKRLLEEIDEKSIPDLNAKFLIADVEKVEENVENFESSLNEGCGVVYYVGHGGAFVWRVGPVDFAQQKDLFTGDNINRLENTGRYPLVFVSSCYTTSFDHQRSLGEEFLLTPDKGAIAVVGSPWKTSVSPNHQFNKAMMGYLFDPAERKRMGGDPDANQLRLGEAFFAVKEKRVVRGDSQIGFTLLGDPTLLVEVPNAADIKKVEEIAAAIATEAAAETVTESDATANSQDIDTDTGSAETDPDKLAPVEL